MPLLRPRSLAYLGALAALASCVRSGFQEPAPNALVDAGRAIAPRDAAVQVVDGDTPDLAVASDALMVDGQAPGDGFALDSLVAQDSSHADALDAAVEDVHDAALEDVHDAAVEDARIGCWAGYHDGGDGRCVPEGTCGAGYHDGGDGSCLPEGSCIARHHDGGDGVCMPDGTCVLGYHDGGDGSCVLDGTCVDGRHDDGCGQCAATGCCADHVEDPPGLCSPAPLAPPIPLDPPDSWPSNTTAPTLRWSTVASVEPVRYDLALSSGPDCSGDLLSVSSLGETWLAVDVNLGLALGTTYYWCVRASDGVHPSSAWSQPSRLPLRGLRTRLRVGRTGPAATFGERLPLLGDAGSGALVIPFASDSWGMHDLGYHWVFDLHRERWALARTTGQSGTLQPDGVEDLVPDGARGDVVGALGNKPPVGLPASSTPRFGAFDPATRTWSALPVQVIAVDAGTPDDGGATALHSATALAADPDADRILVARSTWEPQQTLVYALDRSTSPATLAECGSASVLAAAPRTGVLHRIGASTSFLHLFDDDKYLPATSLFDAVAERWSPTTATTLTSAVIHDVPGLAMPLLIGGQVGELRIWNATTLQWDAWAPVSSTAFHRPYARSGLGWPAHAAYWTAAGDDVIGGVAGLVLEPDAWPVLTLLDAAGGSADGTTARDVQVRIAGDDEATAWLLGEDARAPLADDARWVLSPPTSTTLVGTAGLHRRALWLRYPGGSVGPVPGQASIWYLPAPPPAPAVTVFGYDRMGQVQPGFTETGQITVALEAPLDGIVGFFASARSQPPTIEQFGVGLAPVARTYLTGPSGDVPVYAWVLDAAGQISPMTTRSVHYRDVQAPTLQFGVATAFTVISAESPLITWTSNDLTPPVRVDLRISVAEGDCSGELVSVDGLVGDSAAFDPDLLVPGQRYTACIRGLDSWDPANASGWVQTRFSFQRTAARWHALARLPTDLGYGSAIAYDTSRSRILLFGGFYASNYRAGVHVYDSVANTWSLASVSGTEPHGRGGAMALYDAPRDRLVVTGGFYNVGGQQYPQDTWALDLGTLMWTRLSTTGAAPRRTFAATLLDDAQERWLIGRYTIWTADTVHDPMLFDLATSSWSVLPTFVGYSPGPGNLLPAFASTGPLSVPSTALHDLDLATMTTAPRVTLSGVSLWEDLAAGWDDATGLIVQYPVYIGPTASQTRRTYLVDAQSGLRLRSDAANIPDRGLFGMIRDPVRRSVVMVGGYTRHGDPWVQTYDVDEFRHHGGPRVFASDPLTHDEQVFAGDTVDLAVDWDEGAIAWLVNETAWPAPTSTDTGWVGARPTSYQFADSSPGSRSVFVWIKDSSGAVIEDPGRRDLVCTGP